PYMYGGTGRLESGSRPPNRSLIAAPNQPTSLRPHVGTSLETRRRMKIGILAALFALAVGCDPGVYTPPGPGGSGGQTGSGGSGGSGSMTGTGGTGGNQAMPDAAGNTADAAGTLGAFGDVCTTGANCMSGVCFVGGMGSYCSKTCTTNADCTGLG